jgi:glutathione S-transferase
MAMAEYLNVEDARKLSGLRVVLSPGVPGPWSEAAKGILYVKKIPYVRVRQDIGGENRALVEWSAQATAPVFAWNDEPPRSTWIEQLFLAERLQPTPSLIPANTGDRALMFGYCNELCGEHGFGWSKRLMLVHPTLLNPKVDEKTRAFSQYIGDKYGYNAAEAEGAAARCADIIGFLVARLEQQQAKGSKFYIGNQLSALDIYSAAFTALIQPLPHEQCPMPAPFRKMYTNTDPTIQAAAKPILFAHRDFIYREYLELPIDL